MAQASIQVDVAEHSPELEGVSVSEYFKPGNGVRASANKRTLIFGGGRATQQELAAEGLGKKAVVIAYLPGARVDAAGDADSRRKNLPLRGKMSDGRKVSNVMKVSVGDAGVTVAPDGK